MPYRDLQRDIVMIQQIAQLEYELMYSPQALCLHLEAMPVTIWTGEVVAQLCPSCDAQLPAK